MVVPTVRGYIAGVTEDDAQKAIRQFIVDNFLFGDASAAPSIDQALVKTGVVDSTGILEIVTFLETEWGVQTADEELAAENFGSIAAIARCGARKTAAA